MQRFRVVSGQQDYDVVVGQGAWRALRKFSKARYSSVFILTERPLWKLWGKPFLAQSGLDKRHMIFVPPGEKSKSLRQVEEVASRLLSFGADRQSLLVAFGGGVIGDLGGFVASTYMRGIDYVQVPTTVVAQVDSAVGGKTAVNIPKMKNLIGTFFPPRLALADPAVLSSLKERVFRSGLYEVVKHAILSGNPLFRKLEVNLGILSADNTKVLEPILARAVEVKVDVVSRDEREAGLRRVLNLGHTFGHALEEATQYQRFLHGEAVAWGLVIATKLAERLGLLELKSGGDEERILRLIRQVGPLPPIKDLNAAKILKLLPQDKKAIGGQIHWVLPERIGKVTITPDVSTAIAAAGFRDVQRTGGWER